MKYTRNYCFWFAIVTVVTILLTGCYKDPSKIGVDIQPPSDRIELYGDDSIVLFVSYTVVHDSISTSNLETLVLGSINDPVFGSTQAAFNTQFCLSQINPFFGKDVTFDSICLHLAYSKDGQWGDSTTFLTANVYRLTDSLYFNADTTLGDIKNNYYATDVIGFDPVPIGTKTFLPQPLDSVELKRFWLKRNQDMHAPFISIKLDDELMKTIADSSILGSNDVFLESFYGLHVDVTPVVGSFGKMLYFDRGAPETKLVLYYTNSDSSASYSFPIDSKSSIRFNEYKIDHSTACADLQNQLNSASPETGNQRLYLQPLNGVRIKVNFSGIEKLREKKNIVINDAKLYLNNAEEYDKNLPPVQQLYIYTVEDGKAKPTPDAELGWGSKGYMGGNFDADKNRYVMRITRYLQKRILDEKMDNDNLYITINGASFYANRVMLYGNNPDNKPEEKAKIRILYSEY